MNRSTMPIPGASTSPPPGVTSASGVPILQPSARSGSALSLMKAVGASRRGIVPTLAPMTTKEGNLASNSSFTSATQTPISTPLNSPRSSTLAPIAHPSSATRAGPSGAVGRLPGGGLATPLSFSAATSLSNTPNYKIGANIPAPPLVAGTTRQVNLGVLRPAFTSIYSERLVSEREIEQKAKREAQNLTSATTTGISGSSVVGGSQEQVQGAVQSTSSKLDGEALPQTSEPSITQTRYKITASEPTDAVTSQQAQQQQTRAAREPTGGGMSVPQGEPLNLVEDRSEQMYEAHALAEAARAEFDVTVLNEDHLKNISGYEDLHLVSSLEIALDTTRVTNCDLIGREMKALEELKFTSSYTRIPSWRDLGARLSSLRVLWVSKCSLSDLSGIHFSYALEELYFSYNNVATLEPLAALSSLAICDAEGNCVEDLGALDALYSMGSLVNLSLVGNPIAVTLSMAGGSQRVPSTSSVEVTNNVTRSLKAAEVFPPNLYRYAITRRSPTLLFLDDEPVEQEDLPAALIATSPEKEVEVEAVHEAIKELEEEAVGAVRAAKENASQAPVGGGVCSQGGLHGSALARPQSAVASIRQPTSLAAAHQSLQSQAIDKSSRLAGGGVEARNPTGVSGPALYADPFSQEFSLVYRSIRQNAYDPMLAALGQNGGGEPDSGFLSKDSMTTSGSGPANRTGLSSAQPGARRRVITAPISNLLTPSAVAAGGRLGANGQLIFNNPRQRVPPRSASDALVGPTGSSPGRGGELQSSDGAGGASSLTQVSSVFRGSLTRSLRATRPQPQQQQQQPGGPQASSSSITSMGNTPLSHSASVTSFTSTSARHTPPPPSAGPPIPAAPTSLSLNAVRDEALKPSPPRMKGPPDGGNDKDRSPRADLYGSQSPPISPTNNNNSNVAKPATRGPRNIDEILADTDGMGLVEALYEGSINGKQSPAGEQDSSSDAALSLSTATREQHPSPLNHKRPMTASLSNARPTTASSRPQDSDLIRRAMMLLNEVKESNHKEALPATNQSTLSADSRSNTTNQHQGPTTDGNDNDVSPNSARRQKSKKADEEAGIYNDSDDDDDDDEDLYGLGDGEKDFKRQISPEELERMLLDEGFLGTGGGIGGDGNGGGGGSIGDASQRDMCSDEDLMLEVRRLKAKTARAVAEETARHNAMSVFGGGSSAAANKLGQSTPQFETIPFDSFSRNDAVM